MTSVNSSKNQSYFCSPTREKNINVSAIVIKNLRRLWPKYDKELDQLITGNIAIQELIYKSFKEAGYIQKFKEIGKERAKA